MPVILYNFVKVGQPGLLPHQVQQSHLYVQLLPGYDVEVYFDGTEPSSIVILSLWIAARLPYRQLRRSHVQFTSELCSSLV